MFSLPLLGTNMQADGPAAAVPVETAAIDDGASASFADQQLHLELQELLSEARATVGMALLTVSQVRPKYSKPEERAIAAMLSAIQGMVHRTPTPYLLFQGGSDAYLQCSRSADSGRATGAHFVFPVVSLSRSLVSRTSRCTCHCSTRTTSMCALSSGLRPASSSSAVIGFVP
jgi:hypothetical protein